jgi:hypothetical protein
LEFHIVSVLANKSMLCRGMENHLAIGLEEEVVVSVVREVAFNSQEAVTLEVDSDKVVAHIQPDSSQVAQGDVDIQVKDDWGQGVEERDVDGRLLEIGAVAHIAPVSPTH